MIKSSYLANTDYGDIIKAISFIKQSEKIVEIGILEGYSLLKFIEGTSEECKIEAYDIYDKFNGNHAKYTIVDKFKNYKNVSINYGDFYELYKNISDGSLDILHIDIANNGNILEFTIDNYMQKLKYDGILIFEGGSYERDNIEWMIKYNKPKIKPILDSLKQKYKIITIGSIPSITIIMKQI